MSIFSFFRNLKADREQQKTDREKAAQESFDRIKREIAENSRPHVDEVKQQNLLDKRLSIVREYIDKHYEPPKPQPEPRQPPQTNVRYSLGSLDDDDSPRIRYSLDTSGCAIPNDHFDSSLTLSRLRETIPATRSPAQSVTRTAAVPKITTLSFSEKLQEIMKRKNLSPADLYNRAMLDKSTFSKIVNDPNYKINKDTAIQLAVSLNTSLENANDLLGRAGYKLSHSIERDVIIECCIKEHYINVIDVNLILNEFNCKPLGKGSN